MSRFILVLGVLAIASVTLCDSADVSESVDSLRDRLPGRFMLPDEQCRERRPNYFVTICEPEYTEQLCANLKCTPKRGDIPTGEDSGPALDGTWCAENMMCLGGVCVEDPDPPKHPLKLNNSECCEE